MHLPALFDLKPVIIRAFNSAKTYKPSKNKTDNDYITKGEFRIFLKYMRQYYEYWVAFDRIDTDGDRRLGKNEFMQAKDMLTKWGVDMSNPEK